MSLKQEQIDCNNKSWLSIVNKNASDTDAYINELEAAQTAATAAVTAEVGSARGDSSNLAARLAALDLKDTELAALINSLVLGKTADLYDAATSYVKNDFVIYDGSIYVCLSTDPVSGVLPTDKTNLNC